jgi:DNA-binding SARP family transcriptional activator/tetratricopeptide (TPR) repeat protein
MFEIYLFGPTRVLYNGESLEIQRRPPRILLAYLAAEGKPVSRSKLIGLLWPEEMEDVARDNFRDNLSKLRTDLTGKNQRPDPILGREIIELDPKLVCVDFQKFTALAGAISLDLAALPLHQPLPDELRQKMLEMVRLWNGSELLASDEISRTPELEGWKMGLEMQIQSLALPVLHRLSIHDRLRGDVQGAVNWLYKALTFNEFDDGLHERILHIYLEFGLQTRAREYYSDLRNNYEQEGLTISENIEALRGRIFRTTTGKLYSQSGGWPVKPSVEMPFIGKTETMAGIEKTLRENGAAIVFGEAGEGKTRLARELYLRQATRPRLLLASCQPQESSLPFAPWVSLLREQTRPTEWRALDAAWAVPLSALLPELWILRSDLAPFPKNMLEVPRALLVEAIYQTLLILAGTGRLFLFFDDAQWADESTLAVIASLLKKGFFNPDRNLLLASRSETPNTRLDKVILATYPTLLKRFELHPFDDQETSQLVSHLLGHHPRPDFIQRLQADCGGNPFILLETMQSLLDGNSHLDLETVQNLPLAHSVRQVFQQRIENLSQTARELILTAAILGSRFELDVIERTAGLSIEDTVNALEEVERAHLLQSLPGEKLVFGFVHEKIRESLLLDISLPRQRLLHARIANVLEQSTKHHLMPRSGVLANHFERAGNAEKAFEYWTMAGQYAHRLGSMYEAIEAFRHAEHLIPRTTKLPDQGIYTLYWHWNSAAFELDDAQELERIAQAMQSIGIERKSRLLIGTALGFESDVYMVRNQFAEAYQRAQQGLTHVAKTDNLHELAHIYNQLGVYLYMQGKMRESQPWFVKALLLTEDAVDNELLRERANAYYQMAFTETMCGYSLRGIDYAQKGIQLDQTLGNLYGQLGKLGIIGLSSYLVGRYKEGRTASLRGLEMVERINGWRMYGYLASYAGMNETEMGILGDAWTHAQKAIEIGRTYGHGEIAGLGHKVQGDIYMRLEVPQKALQSYENGMMTAGEHFVALENMHRYGLALYLLGQEQVGLDFIHQAMERTRQSELWSIHFFAALSELYILMRQGEHKIIRERIAWAQKESLARLGFDISVYPLKRLQAQQAFNNQEYEKAYSQMEEAIKWYRRINQVWQELNGLRLQEQCLIHLQKDTTAQRARIDEIVDTIEAQTEQFPIKGEWQRFKKKFV